MLQYSHSISPRAQRQLFILLDENPELKRVLRQNSLEDSIKMARRIVNHIILKKPVVKKYLSKERNREYFSHLSWSDFALIRIYHYLKFEGNDFEDLNVDLKKTRSNPLEITWLAYHQGIGGAKSDFFCDAVQLFRQLKTQKIKRRPSKADLENWMKKHPSGLEQDICKIRAANKQRIIFKFIELMDAGFYSHSSRFHFKQNLSKTEKTDLVKTWWNDHRFHLRFAIRDYKTLDFFLGNSLKENKLKLFELATIKGLPFFINFHYLSLLNLGIRDDYIGSDMPIRDYIFYNKDLIDEFGNIVAWEKEDQIIQNIPNAAGWLLPNDFNIHRRYPDSAIFIPDTMGRSCGGLCVSCQRMYDFQKGKLNFNLEKLTPSKSWNQRLHELLGYFENDKQIRDILITGGDALMSSNNTLRHLLDEVYAMILRKKEANKSRPYGEKYALIERVRLGTRMPVYIPQRIDDELIEILTQFRIKAFEEGVQKCVIQTHFISAMEITPESETAIEKLLSAGWLVTNQVVFTIAVSQKGHTAKLRAELNKIGVLPYYTFSVKGFRENKYNFATNARLAQEIYEEKSFGNISDDDLSAIIESKDVKKAINNYLSTKNQLFLSTDRSLMNLPAIGKSLTFNVIGITFDGRRIIRFRHDTERLHSPIVSKFDDIIIVESKSIYSYIKQLEKKGDYYYNHENLYGYSMFITEKRKSIFKLSVPGREYTKELNHIDLKIKPNRIKKLNQSL